MTERRRKRRAEDVGLKEHWDVGEVAHFEYHCWQSHDSADAELWYRCRADAKIVANGRDLYAYDPALKDVFARGEAGQPRVYGIEFPDGYRGHATEDELLVSPAFFDPDNWSPPPQAEIDAARAAKGPPVRLVRVLEAATERYDAYAGDDPSVVTVSIDGGRLVAAHDVTGETIHEYGDRDQPALVGSDRERELFRVREAIGRWIAAHPPAPQPTP